MVVLTSRDMVDQLLRGLRAGVLILLARFGGVIAVVLVFTQLHVVLDADLATPLVVGVRSSTSAVNTERAQAGLCRRGCVGRSR